MEVAPMAEMPRRMWLLPTVITLTVGGMSCGGCAASVKRILESQPQVLSASVNLTTEVAVVWPVSEAKLTQNLQQQLGEMLAKYLTNCGFTSNIRVASGKWGSYTRRNMTIGANHFYSGSTIILGTIV